MRMIPSYFRAFWIVIAFMLPSLLTSILVLDKDGLCIEVNEDFAEKEAKGERDSENEKTDEEEKSFHNQHRADALLSVNCYKYSEHFRKLAGNISDIITPPPELFG